MREKGNDKTKTKFRFFCLRFRYEPFLLFVFALEMKNPETPKKRKRKETCVSKGEVETSAKPKRIEGSFLKKVAAKTDLDRVELCVGVNSTV